MSLPLVRRPENWKFTHAAAAMGEFWARARNAEDSRTGRKPERRRPGSPPERAARSLAAPTNPS